MRYKPFIKEQFEKEVETGLIRPGSLVELVTDNEQKDVIKISNIGYFVEYSPKKGILTLASRKSQIVDIIFFELNELDINNLMRDYKLRYLVI